MQRITTKHFEKRFSKLPSAIKQKAIERISLFLKSPFDPLLHNHKLHGDLNGYRSINVTADIRIVYKTINENAVLFIDIGSHSELYE